MQVRLIWITPNAEQHIAYCARVSNPANQDNPEIAGLIRYCMEHGHWSIFEMANACFEIVTSRAISAQIIRHKSMSFPDGEGVEFAFQEFSQRYAVPENLEEVTITQQQGRQAAIEIEDEHKKAQFRALEIRNWNACTANYEQAIYDIGVSRETARTLMPIGARTRLYMNGTIRSWIHYIRVRTERHTQHDHRAIAEVARYELAQCCPIIAELEQWI